MKPRRKKGRLRKMNKNNPFLGEKAGFCKNKKTNNKTNKKMGLGPAAPKHTCRVALTPNPKRKRRKEQNTKKKMRGISRDHLSNSGKQCQRNNPEKIAKTLRTAAAKRFSATSPTRTQKRDTPAHQKFHKSVFARKKCEKRHFQNDLSSAAPSRFLPSKPNFVKNSNVQNNIRETRKNYSQKSCAESKRCNVSNASSRGTKTPNRSETTCFDAFCVLLLPLGVRRQEPRRQRREKKTKKLILPSRKKTKLTSEMAIFKKKSKTTIG